MELAEVLDVNPWAALLLSIRLAAFHCEEVDAILAALRNGTAVDIPIQGLHSHEELVRAWQHESRMERQQLARTAKMAIDAGVAERLVREVELEGKLVAMAVVAALDALGVEQDSRTRALEAAHRKLSESIEMAPEYRKLPPPAIED